MPKALAGGDELLSGLRRDLLLMLWTAPSGADARGCRCADPMNASVDPVWTATLIAVVL
jgi:hypothetical protein